MRNTTLRTLALAVILFTGAAEIGTNARSITQHGSGLSTRNHEASRPLFKADGPEEVPPAFSRIA